MSQHYEPDIADALDRDIGAVINKHMSVATPEEAIIATMGACASVIAGIQCADCRKLAAESAMKSFPKIIADALKFAADLHGDDTPTDHLH